MILRVLGCSGSEMPAEHNCSFRVGRSVLVDMGAASSGLPLEQRSEIRDIFLTHAHLDHTKDLGFFAESVFGVVSEPIRVRGTEETLDLVRRHLLNDLIWPDFTRLPTRDAPVLRYEPIRAGEEVAADGLRVLPIRVPHMIGSVGFVLSSARGTVVLSGDTGPSEALPEAISRAGDGLQAVLLEASFPNRLQELADASGHLTPRTLAQVLSRAGNPRVPVYAYHLKAPTRAETVADIEALRDPRIHVLCRDVEIEF